MAPLLRPGDSFNSSSATIRADDSRRPATRALPCAGGGLGPAESIGRGFESIAAGKFGLLQSDSGVDEQEFVRRYIAGMQGSSHDPDAPLFTNGSSTAPLGRLPSEFNPLAFINDSTDGTFFAELPPDAIPEPPATVPSAPANGAELYRPSSALSHHSHLSLSTTDIDSDSAFYTTTDMDTDQEFDAGPSSGPNPVAELDTLNLNNTAAGFIAAGTSSAGASPAPISTISPGAAGLGSSRRVSTTKRSRSPTDSPAPEGTDADDAEHHRLKRLEHRRSINRRSAQKHRLRRKEELETLTQQLAQRDARIAQMEKDLAVTRAQLQTALESQASLHAILRSLQATITATATNAPN